MLMASVIFNFENEGALNVKLNCSLKTASSYSFDDQTKGRWKIKNNKLCLQVENELFVMGLTYRKVGEKEICWDISETKSGLKLTHPKNKSVINLKSLNKGKLKTSSNIQGKDYQNRHINSKTMPVKRYWAGQKETLDDGYGNELTIKYSEDGLKFTVEWSYFGQNNGVAYCSGQVSEDGELETIPCKPEFKNNPRDIGGTIHKIRLLNYHGQSPAGPWLNKKLNYVADQKRLDELNRQK